ncbi:MAG: hypothetical protein GEV06_18305 [Luteitalea sp.]|nr:hypothetical protein [Luteitalea sp.]
MKKLMLPILVLVAAVPWLVSAQQASSVDASAPLMYLDPSQPLDRRVDDLIARMTLPEKVSLLGTTAPAIERLRIPVMNGWNQSLHGIVWTQPTTMFPVPISMAATWNPALVHEVAAAIADEGRAIHNSWAAISTIRRMSKSCRKRSSRDC